ncbi:MAG: glycosyltransferase family 39 protein [Anaerolineaceae bacterium]|nr:glycosyltransferase family 39 protein [Anaerolineaceae bacterium]
MTHTYWENQLTFYYYGRMLICILGSIIPLVGYKIGKEFKINFAVPAAIIFAFFPSFVIHSHYITPDIPITLITMLVILFAIKYLNDEKSIYLYIATIFSAINTAEKYPGLLSIVVILATISIHVFRNDKLTIRDKFAELLKGGLRILGIFLLAFYVVAPNIFIEFGKVIQTIQYEARSTHLGADNLGWFGNLIFYIESYSSFTNIFATIFMIFGILHLIKNKNPNLILLFYGTFYWVFMSYLPLHWERWALPMYITPLLIISIGITYLFHITRYKKILRIISLLIIVGFISHQFMYSLSSSIKLSFTDTRVVALDYCIENGITSENSIYEGYTPFNPQNPGNIFDFDINNNIDKKYIILSSGMYDRYQFEPNRYKDAVKFYKEVRSNNIKLKEINATDVNHGNPKETVENIVYYIKILTRLIPVERYNGPTIQIFEIPTNH